MTGSIPRREPENRVVARPMPPLAQAKRWNPTGGTSGGGSGMASYQPQSRDITGSIRTALPPPPPPPPPPQPRWTWQGGIPITVAPGETLDMISRKYRVPVSAIMQANNITHPSDVQAGRHLVVPRYRPAPTTTAYAPPPPRYTAPAYAPRTYEPSSYAAPPRYQPPRTRSSDARADEHMHAQARGGDVHVVRPGETLNSIARLYHKSVREIARANNIPPDTMVRVGERLMVPGVHADQRSDQRAEAPRVEAPRAEGLAPTRRRVAEAAPPPSAWKATVEPVAQPSPIKKAEPVGALPSFRWPVHGRIIAGFGPEPNGLQNDGIDVAVPEGTPIKAADDGVVAYAGNELKGYGNLVLIRHNDGYVTAYAHASELLVKRGERVKRGQVIAKAGETGNVRTPELHFEIRRGATPVNPAQFLAGG